MEVGAGTARQSRLVAALWPLVVVLVVVHLVRPTGVVGDTTYLVAVGAAPVLAWFGTVWAPAGARMVPALIASGLTASALGDLIWSTYGWLGHEPDVSLADIPYLASYLGLGAALVVLTLVRRDGATRVDLDAIIDGLTVVVISVLMSWSLSAHLVDADPSLPAFTRIVWAAYPVADAVLLALVLRALSARDAGGGLRVSFAVGVACWLASDLGYAVLASSVPVMAVLDVGWMVGGLLMATSTLGSRPAAESRTETDLAARPAFGKLWIAVIPLLVPPVLLLVTEPLDTDAVAVLFGLLVLVAIAFVRTARLLRSESRVRAELATARDAALEGSRAQSAFLATMSHEIRTPMNGVIGLTDLLLTSDLDERQRQYAEGVRSAGNALLTIINEILDFSKVEAGHLELEMIDFDVVHLVEEVAEMLADTAQKKDLELLAYCSPELPVGLRGDPARLRQVLLNLTGNAVKFTAAGEVVVRAQLEASSGDGAVVRFEVSDTGIGVDKADRARLFEPFSQADSSTTRQYGGTGLGLAICRRLVSAMGGTLGVDSRDGEGSTFWFTVPLGLAEDPSVAPLRRSDLLAGLRALVVDDNHTNRVILHDQLEAWGMSVDVADGGATALAMLGDAAREGRPFDVGVLDLCMPEMDGLDLARRITADPDLGAAGLVLLTSGLDVSQTEARASGFAASMTKPVQLSRLRSTLQDIVGVRRERAPAAEVAPAPSARGRILVVEDGEINQLVATGMLEHFGYTVDVADDGFAALAAIRRTTYDAVLMDVQMPGMDGYEATSEIRSIEGAERRTPIIAMTAGAVEGDRERCLAAGMDDYLSKPIDLAAVGRVVAHWVPAR